MKQSRSTWGYPSYKQSGQLIFWGLTCMYMQLYGFNGSILKLGTRVAHGASEATALGMQGRLFGCCACEGRAVAPSTVLARAQKGCERRQHRPQAPIQAQPGGGAAPARLAKPEIAMSTTASMRTGTRPVDTHSKGAAKPRALQPPVWRPPPAACGAHPP